MLLVPFPQPPSPESSQHRNTLGTEHGMLSHGKYQSRAIITMVIPGTVGTVPSCESAPIAQGHCVGLVRIFDAEKDGGSP